MRSFIIDTVATVVFFTAFATFSELVIARLEPMEVLTTRLVTVPIMLLTGRPYTLWRDWILSVVQPASRIGILCTDIGAFLAFQVPIYGATLIFAGANGQEALLAISSSILFMIFLARPFGVFIDLVRRAFGIGPSRQ